METEDRMAASIPGRRIPLVCTDLIIPSPQPASQSGDERGAESPERQDLIGDGQTDWMTEKVDLSSFLTTTESSPSSSLPPSPLEQDVKVPSDLEVMTSLLQEELAQLEDYFRSESSTKPDKPSRCERGAQAMGAQSYYQLPYTSSYSTSQSETSPVVVTLATGELDLAGFCGGPVGRPKMARPAPYSYHRYHSNGRRTVPESVKVGQEVGHEAWSPKGSYSGSAENLCSSLRSGGKSFCGVKKVRECSLSLKEEESYCFSEGMFCSEEIARGFCVGSSFESHKRDGQLTHNQKVNGSYDAAGLEVLHCNKDGGLPGGGAVPVLPPGGEGYFHQPLAAPEPYHSFIAELEQPPQAHALEPPHAHYLYPECLSDQSYECLSRGGGEGPMLGGLVQRPAPRLKDDPLKPALLATPPPEAPTGERKQKKRDQNKTAAHRYRVRKRAELDCLEEELHGLEGQNRELRDKAESVEREIQYVKDLLIEVYKARSQRLKQDGSA